MNRWQFSLRALLILMAVVAAITAFVANYPTAALFIIFGTGWVLFESGAIFEIIEHLNKPEVFARHPLLATAVWFFSGLVFFTVSGFFLWHLIHFQDAWQLLLLLMMTTIFSGLAFRCFWLLRNSFYRQTQAEAAPKPDQTSL